jgi:siroheme synthase (precorrin-2 oxidase/ferrochelatase)
MSFSTNNKKQCEDLLKQMQLRDNRKPLPIYILGCFDKRVTLYSQQTRALNLIYALFKTEQLKADDQVVIIGAGAAGLTAATAALDKGCEVILLEKEPKPLNMFRNNKNRWLHPHIYDWPNPGSENNDAQLPLMNWTADLADKVAEQLLKEWEKICNHYINKIKFYTETTIKKIDLTGQISIQWEGWLNSEKYELTKRPKILIVAVGFGKEEYRPTYWEAGTIDDVQGSAGNPKKYLVVGCGDGGLIDTLRIRIRNFKHVDVDKTFFSDSDLNINQQFNRLKKELAEVDESLKDSPENLIPEELHNHYGEIYNKYSSAIESKFKTQLRNDTSVTLVTITDYPYTLNSSVLNRFLVYCLRKIPDKATEHLIGKVVEAKNNQAVLDKDGEISEISYDEIIWRIGPEPAIKALTAIYKLRDSLKNFEILDQTRQPLWESDDEFGVDLFHLSNFDLEDFITMFRFQVKRIYNLPTFHMLVLGIKDPLPEDLLTCISDRLKKPALKNELKINIPGPTCFDNFIKGPNYELITQLQSNTTVYQFNIGKRNKLIDELTQFSLKLSGELSQPIYNQSVNNKLILLIFGDEKPLPLKRTKLQPTPTLTIQPLDAPKVEPKIIIRWTEKVSKYFKYDQYAVWANNWITRMEASPQGEWDFIYSQICSLGLKCQSNFTPEQFEQLIHEIINSNNTD